MAAASNDAGRAEVVTKADHLVRCGCIAVKVCAKRSERDVEVDPAGSGFTPIQLVDEAIGTFAGMASGVMAGLALKGLAAIRRNTARILSTFSQDLDAGFLIHRSLCLPNDHAEEQVLPLLISEIEAAVEDDVESDIRLSGGLLRDWLESHKAPQEKLNVLAGEFEPDTEAFRAKLLTEGSLGLKKENWPAGKWKLSDWSKAFNDKGRAKAGSGAEVMQHFPDAFTENGRISCLKFGALIASRSVFSSEHRVLTLGTVISWAEDDGVYYAVCLQPVCDALIRDDDPHRAFPFLKLTKRSAANQALAFAVNQERDDPIDFVARFNPYCMFPITFTREENGYRVIANAREGGFFFEEIRENPRRFKWLAQLRPDHAQRFAEKVSAQQGRVGLTESEWMRHLARAE